MLSIWFGPKFCGLVKGLTRNNAEAHNKLKPLNRGVSQIIMDIIIDLHTCILFLGLFAITLEYKNLKWYSNCSTDFTFTSFHDISLQQCYEQCASRKNCQYFQYRSKFHLCELCGNKKTSFPFGYRAKNGTSCWSGVPPVLDYNDVFFRDTNLGLCYPNTCQIGEVCVSLDGQSVTCLVKECELQTVGQNVNIRGNVNEVGSRMMISCIDGFSGSSGHIQIVCARSGNWSASVFSCFQDCSTPPSLAYTETLTNAVSLPIYTTLQYSCINGYSSSEPLVITCEPDHVTLQGYWTTPTSSCLPECGTPSIESATILNSTSNISYPSGALLAYRCLSGYAPSTVQSMICNGAGFWEVQSACSVAQCTGSLASLYEVDPTYGICYKFYNSILLAVSDICNTFGGTLLDIESNSDKTFAIHIMDVKSCTHLYIGSRHQYLYSAYADWAVSEPNNNGDCVQIVKIGHEYLWSVVECTSTLDYIIIKNV